MILATFLLIVGFVVLVVGAESLVRGATNIAKTFGISTLVIGLTVVAFGTSAPELFVSLVAAFKGTADVAVGNVIGSNIFNVLMIIGCSAIIAPVEISYAVRRREMPIMLITLGLMYLVAWSGVISRWEGWLLFVGILVYLVWNYLSARRSVTVVIASKEEESRPSASGKFIFKNINFVILGLVGLVFGSNLIVDNATFIAKTYGVSDLVIGITLVAVGTSLPELATTVVAAIKGEPDLAVGNAIGSNVFNVLCVIGLTAGITPLSVNPQALSVDLIVMLVSCFAVWPLMLYRRKFGRLEGGLLVLVYAGYIAYLALNQVAT